MKVVQQVSAGGIVYKKISNPYSLVPNPYTWLICRHSQHKGWVFPKGFVGDVNKNESNETAALREVEEEGGVKAKIVSRKPIETHYEFELKGTLFKKTVFLFLMEYLSGDPKNHDWEMSEAKFVTEEEVKKILTYPSDKEAFAKILQGL
ncbi:MAG: NUDIX hydrolase [Candidatus Roizmanbacteria bacterium GW2011_GWA2_33_33]|uniref:NUDIX hydrolase n=2 Tax=Candidatus Roizmaniibacteriota TaxID=1752723 RepID=A0A0G0B1L1_9BACT|nr:MAG: NUDIX hydrolase [Candidatus Roizmanbacteria bacterium GW2011_GWA2_33_33]KKP63219.1 MAG: NUDIX hydrolase [Candidatus Roizmanbacteria bacterium GW2011_GWC2_34_23]